MNQYELYINNQLIELEDKFSFGLIYESPVFKDISKIASNGSTTIKIPPTTNNLRAVENCQMADNITDFPYDYQNTSLWKNGIPIIPKGISVILKVEKYIEIAVIWGNINNTGIFGDKKLRELSVGTENDYLDWNENLTFMSTPVSLFGFIYADFGQGFGVKQYTHPVVSLGYLLRRISSEFGISIQYPQEYYNPFLNTWIPLMEKNANQISWNDSVLSLISSVGHRFGEKILYLTFPDWENNKTLYGEYINNYQYKAFQKTEYNLHIDSSSLIVTSNYDPNALKLIVSVNDVVVLTSNYTRVVNNPGTNNNTIYFENIDIPISMSENDIMSFGYYFENGITGSPSILQGNESMSITNSAFVPFGSKYPIVPNLPDITCIDALKTITAMFGLFVYYDIDNPGQIKLFSIDDIYANKSKAKNWTDKLITGNRLDSIEYTFQDYAQDNYIRYQEDDSVNINADGSIKVNNRTLSKEKDIIKLKFSPSDMKNDFAYIPIYTKDDEGNIVYNKLNSRILDFDLFLTDPGPKLYIKGVFSDAMYFDTQVTGNRIGKYYSKYQQILSRPKVIIGSFKLEELDLYNIDLLIPIYIEQTGQYYAIIEIQVSENRSKVKLLQM